MLPGVLRGLLENGLDVVGFGRYLRSWKRWKVGSRSVMMMVVVVVVWISLQVVMVVY
jgi:hypothetical protein